MFARFASLLLAVALVPVAGRAIAENPPEELYSWETQGVGRVQWHQGNLYHCADGTLGLYTDWTKVGTPSASLASPGAYSMRNDGWMYVIDWGGSKFVHVLNPALQADHSFGRRTPAPPEYWPYALAHDADGNLYLADGRENRILKFDADDNLVAQWGSPGSAPGQFNEPVCLTVSPRGDLLVGDIQNGRLDRFDLDGNYLGEVPHDGVWTPQDVAFDPQGMMYVVDHDPDFFRRDRIVKIDPQGATVTEWHVPYAYYIAVGDDGYVYVGAHDPDLYEQSGRIYKFDNHPGPTMAPRTHHEPALALHVEALSGAFDCGYRSLDPAGMATAAEVPVEGGASYRAYVLAAPNTVKNLDAGITGAQFGIEYDADTAPGQGIEVLGWSNCALLQFADPDWPATGANNTVTWSTEPLTCQRRDLVIVGYLEIVVHDASVLRLRPFQATGLAKIADCGGAEQEVDLQLSPLQLGWVSFGGAAVGSVTGGCNPLLRPCEEAVSVEPTTWSGIKNRLGSGR